MVEEIKAEERGGGILCSREACTNSLPSDVGKAFHDITTEQASS
jgi:hypothetical protein